MLNLIKVLPTDPPLQSHSIHEGDDVPKMCVLDLHDQYDAEGNRLPGRCSRICKHGVVICTTDFDYKFPFLIQGGLADAESEETEEMTG